MGKVQNNQAEGRSSKSLKSLKEESAQFPTLKSV